MDAPIRYVRDKAAAAHIRDHLSERSDRALCGHFYNEPIELKQGVRPRSVVGLMRSAGTSVATNSRTSILVVSYPG
jgi:hypothetical protein